MAAYTIACGPTNVERYGIAKSPMLKLGTLRTPNARPPVRVPTRKPAAMRARFIPAPRTGSKASVGVSVKESNPTASAQGSVTRSAIVLNGLKSDDRTQPTRLIVYPTAMIPTRMAALTTTSTRCPRPLSGAARYALGTRGRRGVRNPGQPTCE